MWQILGRSEENMGNALISLSGLFGPVSLHLSCLEIESRDALALHGVARL